MKDGQTELKIAGMLDAANARFLSLFPFPSSFIIMQCSTIHSTQLSRRARGGNGTSIIASIALKIFCFVRWCDWSQLQITAVLGSETIFFCRRCRLSSLRCKTHRFKTDRATLNDESKKSIDHPYWSFEVIGGLARLCWTGYSCYFCLETARWKAMLSMPVSSHTGAKAFLGFDCNRKSDY